ncbi:MAG: hypothetical protein HY301_15365 [Verrucomicrobia bacterium]|nr:hypothetical protein [Verrucomicrobiota bacterium]
MSDAPIINAPRPPGQDQVVARAVCLGALVLRGYLEQLIQFLDNPATKHTHIHLAAKLNGWLKQHGFARFLTMKEGTMLAEHFGQWSAAHIDERPRQTEALGVLLWGLSVHANIPTYDTPFDLPDLEPLLGFPNDQLGQPDQLALHAFPRLDPKWLQEKIQLRPPAVVEGLRGSAESWLWRATVAEAERAGTPPPEGQTYASLVTIGANEAFAVGAIPKPQEGDFVLFGKRYAEFTDEQFATARLLADTRSTALHWLAGYATRWDELPLRG